MSSEKEQKLQEDLKRREYLKQQQQLRNMTKPKTNISADAMIENLLSKKEIFQKKSPAANSQNQQMIIPPMYLAIWNWCKVAGSAQVADTNKISSLLMTSRLSTDALGYIWSLANQTVPGSLTQHELYSTLALVALAQSGYSFRSIAVVNQLGRYPIPILDTSLMSGPSEPNETPTFVPASSVSLGQSVSSPPVNPHPLQITTPFSQPIGYFNAQKEDDDEFDDFKSADLSSLNVESLKVLEMSATKSSLIRFDSPKRPSPALSILESPSKEPHGTLTVLDMPLTEERIDSGRRVSPEQLSVLDLPLTETSHQPPFDTAVTIPSVQSASAPTISPPTKTNFVQQIHSISGSVDSPTHSGDSSTHSGDSPAHPVDDLFPKCVVKKNQTPDLLDWDSVPSQEEYLTCDLTSHKIELNSDQKPQADIVDMKMIDTQLSEGVDNVKLDNNLQSVESFPELPENGKILKCDVDVKLDSIKVFESLRHSNNTSSSTRGELNLSEFESKPSDSGVTGGRSLEFGNKLNLTNNFLDVDDKYSALRGLEPKASDEFGDFIMAEPVSLISDPQIIPQLTIQEQSMEAVFGLLQQAIKSFKNINDEKVLIEVLDDPRCKEYLEELGEVYNVGDRLSKLQEMKEKKYELENLWSTLGTLTRQALPQIRRVLPEEGAEAVRCGVCLQESSLSLQIGYAMNHFHPACANLYLNRVSGASLPLQ